MAQDVEDVFGIRIQLTRHFVRCFPGPIAQAFLDATL
jgi:hypothetical protein